MITNDIWRSISHKNLKDVRQSVCPPIPVENIRLDLTSALPVVRQAVGDSGNIVHTRSLCKDDESYITLNLNDTTTLTLSLYGASVVSTTPKFNIAYIYPEIMPRFIRSPFEQIRDIPTIILLQFILNYRTLMHYHGGYLFGPSTLRIHCRINTARVTPEYLARRLIRGQDETWAYESVLELVDDVNSPSHAVNDSYNLGKVVKDSGLFNLKED